MIASVSVGSSLKVESSFASTINADETADDSKVLVKLTLKDSGYLLTPGSYCIAPITAPEHDWDFFPRQDLETIGLEIYVISNGSIRVRNMNSNHAVRVVPGMELGTIEWR